MKNSYVNSLSYNFKKVLKHIRTQTRNIIIILVKLITMVIMIHLIIIIITQSKVGVKFEA